MSNPGLAPKVAIKQESQAASEEKAQEAAKEHPFGSAAHEEGDDQGLESATAATFAISPDKAAKAQPFKSASPLKTATESAEANKKA